MQIVGEYQNPEIIGTIEIEIQFEDREGVQNEKASRVHTYDGWDTRDLWSKVHSKICPNQAKELKIVPGKESKLGLWLIV